MKRLFKIIALCLLLGYLTVSLFLCMNRASKEPIHGVHIVVKDSLERRFIDAANIERQLRKAELFPVDELLRDVDTELIEQSLLSNDIIDEAVCYRSNNGGIVVEVTQRHPILRVFADGGESYYMDREGKQITVVSKIPVNVPLISGNMESVTDEDGMLAFADYVYHHPFWNAQIEQIHIVSAREVNLIPRVGDHVVQLGAFDDYERKLAHLKCFYEKVLPQVGWNAYSKISLKNDNQVVCTRRGRR